MRLISRPCSVNAFFASFFRSTFIFFFKSAKQRAHSCHALLSAYIARLRDGNRSTGGTIPISNQEIFSTPGNGSEESGCDKTASYFARSSIITLCRSVIHTGLLRRETTSNTYWRAVLVARLRRKPEAESIPDQLKRRVRV